MLEDWRGPLPDPAAINDSIDPEAEPAAFVPAPYEPAERVPAAA